MERMESLAEYLGLEQLDSAGGLRPVDAADPKQFAEAVLSSQEFRQYILNGLTLGELPAGVVTRLMDVAGWPKAMQRVEVGDAQRMEDLTPEIVAEKLERVQRMLHLLRAARSGETFSRPDADDAQKPFIH